MTEATAPLRRFSHSLVDSMLDCARRTWYRYIEEIPSGGSPALLKGSSCDDGFNEAMARKLPDATLPELTLDELKTVVESSYRERLKNEGGYQAFNWEGEEPKASARKHLNSALAMAEQWHERLYPDIYPTAVQVELHRELPSGRDFVGFLDWRGSWDERFDVIGDNKTGKRRMAGNDADRALQPSAYAWLLDEAITFAFTRVIDTGKTTYTELVMTSRNIGDVAWYGQLLEEVEQQWEAGNFPPNPKSFLCGSKFCPYYERCMPHRVSTINANLEENQE